MSTFTINRIGNALVKKSVNITAEPNINNKSKSLGSTGISTIGNVQSLSLNNIPVLASAEQINKTSISTLGIAESSKILTTNNNTNISDINAISCNSLIAGGQNITFNSFIISFTNDINNSYLTGLINGSASILKALTTDKFNNVSGINTLSLKEISINQNNIKNSNTLSNTLILKSYENIYSTNAKNINSINSLFNPPSTYSQIMLFTGNGLINTNFWPSICWSSELSLFVAVSNDSSSSSPGVNRVMTSNNGTEWVIRSAIDNQWRDVIWISKLKLFVAVSSSGTNNQIMTSPDGINWSAQVTPTSSIGFNLLVWSNELNRCIAIGRTTNISLYSNDCINWSLAYREPPTLQIIDMCWSPELNIFCACTLNGSSYGIAISNDGLQWTVTHLTDISYSICWSSYHKIFIITGGSTTSRVLKYSSNAINWNLGYISFNINSIIWIDELKLFCGHDNSGYIYTSASGITNWNRYQIDTSLQSSIGKLAWSPELGIIIAAMSQGWTASASGERINLINPPYIGKKPSILCSKSMFRIDQTNNLIGFNISQFTGTRPVEINANNGNVLKYSYSTNLAATTFDILSDGKFNITTPNFNIRTDYSTYGLKLNNILVTTPISRLNTLSNVTDGIAQALSPLITNSSNNISNINLLSCSTLSINGNLINSTQNNIYFQNTIIGTATSSKALITDINNRITNINKIDANNIQVYNNNILLKNKINESTYNLTIANNKINNPNIEYYYRTFSTGLTINFTPATSLSYVIWVTELNLFIGLTSTRILTSSNGINWTNRLSTVSPFSSITSWSCIAWSPDLNLLVALNTSLSNYRVLTSQNGLTWNLQFNDQINYTWTDIVWASELKLFVAVSNTSNQGRIMVSQNGNNWTIVNYNSSVGYNKIIWSNKLNLFIVTTLSASDPIYISTDGTTWNKNNIRFTANPTFSILSGCWSDKLNMFILLISGEQHMYYSYDGYTWSQFMLPFSNSGMQKIQWIGDLNAFIISPMLSTQAAYSNDGFNWYRTQFAISGSGNVIDFAWSSDLKKILWIPSNSNGLLTPTIFPTNSLNVVSTQSNNLIINKSNGFMGIGLNPSYQLELSTDSAAKATGTTWSTTSDYRLKENIENANLDICYDNFKNINLVRYKWKNDIYDDNAINDRYQLGWIAQDIEPFLPKSVTSVNKFELSDCKLLNSDQLLTTLYGTVQKLILNFENQHDALETIENKLKNIEDVLNNLEIVS